jgi:hypothetical protein
MKDNFFQFYNDLTAMVNHAIDDIDELRFKLEGVRARIDDIKTSHIEQKNMLQTITAKLQELTLANFLLV